MEERKRRQVSVLGPVLLIGAGTILLLNTLGILDWSIWWTILRLWPVLLIAAGLELLLGRFSIWGSLLAVVLVMAVLFGSLWLSTAGLGGSGGVAAEEISHPLGGAERAQVHIDPGVGVLRIAALAEPGNLVHGVAYLGKGEQVSEEYSQSDGEAKFVLKTTGGEPWTPFFAGPDERRAWELGFSPSPDLDLSTSLGLGEAELDLTGLNVSELRTNMGLGFTEITLPDQGPYQARIDGAIGVTTIFIPEGLAVRIRVDSGLATRELPDGYHQQAEKIYVSPGYDESKDRIDLNVSQPMGVVRIRYRE